METNMEWKPVAEYKPEFGDVLVCVTFNLGAPEDDYETVQWVDFIAGDKWAHFLELIHVPFPPTHWMPLPSAPKALPTTPKEG